MYPMNSRERVLLALDHQEADRVPIDLGGTVVSSIALSTYAALRDYFGLPKKKRPHAGNGPTDSLGG
jgi:uroporphyrinogen decarboxylase